MIDPRPACLMHDGLDHKELVFEVYSHCMTPALRGYFFNCVARLVSDVVDEHVDWVEALKDVFNRRFDCRSVAQVAVEVDGRSEAGCFNFF